MGLCTMSYWGGGIDFGCSKRRCVVLPSIALPMANSYSRIPDSIKDTASKVAYDLMSRYTGNHTGDVPGNLPAPYYWWEAGAMFGSMVEYWYYTGDTTYNAEVIQAMQHQRGKANNYEPSNQTASLGNDDQMFWAFAAMGAAELGFENPAEEDPSWLSLAQAVFNRQTARWDPATCNGGLRWQMILANVGFDYKNSVTNLGLFQLSARLGRYTGNQTYVDWANKIWDWYEGSSLYDAAEYKIWDGAHTTDNCTDASREQWSYTYGILTAGMAYLYNHVSIAWNGEVSHRRSSGEALTIQPTDRGRSVADQNRWHPKHNNRNLLPTKHGPEHHGRMDLRTLGSLQQ
jgi:mannan endo-1,6-alpha-mannosidase